MVLFPCGAFIGSKRIIRCIIVNIVLPIASGACYLYSEYKSFIKTHSGENNSGKTQWRKAIRCIIVNIVLPIASDAGRLHKLMSNNRDPIIFSAMNWVKELIMWWKLSCCIHKLIICSFKIDIDSSSP